MRRHLMQCLFRLNFLFAALWFSQTPVTADTIVLKNGRRILALSVVEEGDKVKYQTAAGELSLPKSIVDHVEHGGAIPLASGASEAAGASLAPPSVESSVAVTGANEIERSAVHDGSIDRTYIAGLESEARSGRKDANLRAAIAHHAAAQYELGRGDMEHALGDEKTALIYQPEEPALLMYTGYLHLRRSEYKQGLEYLERAKRFAPNNADQAALSGWAYEGLNKMDEAVQEYKRSYALRPDPAVKSALEKVLRDKKEEESYKENESAHFNLKYNGSAEPALARDVMRTLEGHFAAIESELNYTPPESIGVILYTREAFLDITQAPGWVGALNDGRIRVPVQGLNGVDGELSRVLKHELTHSFLRQKTRGAVPTWLNEGLAQWMEGKRSNANGAVLAQIYNAGHAASLGRLEGSWMGLGGDQASYAYAWGLANTEYIIQSGGMGDVERILDRIARGESTEAALRGVLHSDYNDLMKSTAEYLSKAYGR
jgi:tetratricopeptide (TPR) repeat protein